jgi:hypothetical protein
MNSPHDRVHDPTASAVHFVVKLFLAAPASFFSSADFVQAAPASFWHLLMKLFSAAPANFFSAACALQVGGAAGAAVAGAGAFGAAVWPMADVAHKTEAAMSAIILISVSLNQTLMVAH